VEMGSDAVMLHHQLQQISTLEALRPIMLMCFENCVTYYVLLRSTFSTIPVLTKHLTFYLILLKMHCVHSKYYTATLQARVGKDPGLHG
jgi:hypothetical protein